MEKKRRARINASLAELKSLLLDVMKSEVNRKYQLRSFDIVTYRIKSHGTIHT